MEEDPLELLKNSTLTILWSFEIGKVKKLDKWVPHELTRNRKNGSFQVLSFLILYNNKNFLDRIVTFEEKWILYPNWWRPTWWLDQNEAPKHFLKSHLHQHRSWLLSGGLLPVWSTAAFWILVKPLHSRSMFIFFWSKSIGCNENCNACSWLWSWERA